MLYSSEQINPPDIDEAYDDITDDERADRNYRIEERYKADWKGDY